MCRQVLVEFSSAEFSWKPIHWFSFLSHVDTPKKTPSHVDTPKKTPSHVDTPKNTLPHVGAYVGVFFNTSLQLPPPNTFFCKTTSGTGVMNPVSGLYKPARKNPETWKPVECNEMLHKAQISKQLQLLHVPFSLQHQERAHEEIHGIIFCGR